MCHLASEKVGSRIQNGSKVKSKEAKNQTLSFDIRHGNPLHIRFYCEDVFRKNDKSSGEKCI